MNIQEFANLLNGREMDEEITLTEELQAKELGFVIVFGASDDLAELRGAIYDEVSCYNDGTLYFGKDGILENKCDDENCPYYAELKKSCKTIEAVWDEDGYSWIYKTDIPHATFEIMEDEERYCRGIVFEIKSL